mmetsp:Transcript_16813/g.48861  ORF Transcript_16813/g.48861 Transcript_16813/m.48861 type:complete len:208 (+) Transcript_16813:948-1571(+)
MGLTLPQLLLQRLVLCVRDHVRELLSLLVQLALDGLDPGILLGDHLLELLDLGVEVLLSLPQLLDLLLGTVQVPNDVEVLLVRLGCDVAILLGCLAKHRVLLRQLIPLAAQGRPLGLGLIQLPAEHADLHLEEGHGLTDKTKALGLCRAEAPLQRRDGVVGRLQLLDEAVVLLLEGQEERTVRRQRVYHLAEGRRKDPHPLQGGPAA